jgi:hypothetical protein
MTKKNENNEKKHKKKEKGMNFFYLDGVLYFRS